MRAWHASHGGNKRLSPEARKKMNARSYLHVYLKRGKIVKKPCEICGSPKSQAHHEDYDYPLIVHWLCIGHHEDVHRGKIALPKLVHV